MGRDSESGAREVPVGGIEARPSSPRCGCLRSSAKTKQLGLITQQPPEPPLLEVNLEMLGLLLGGAT